MADVLKPRAARLIEVLLQKNEPVVVEQLAKQFGVSPRSIRYDLAEVKEWVAKRGMTLIAQPRVGVKLSGDPEKVLKDLDKAQRPSYQAPLMVSDRRAAILIALLQATRPIPLAVLADCLYVSRSTIKSDVAALKQELKHEGLCLKHKPGVGHYICGEESAIRRKLAKLLFKKSPVGLEVVPWANLVPDAQVIGREHLETAWHVASSFRIETRLCLDPDTFSEFVAMLTVTVGRVLGGHKIKIDPERLSPLSRTKEFLAVKKIAHDVRQLTGATFEPGDVGFITKFLFEMGQFLDLDVGEHAERDIAQECAQLLILCAQRNLGVDLQRDDELRSGLVSHLQRIIYLRKLGISPPNPLLSQVKKQYPLVYEVCLQGARAISQKIGHDLDENEAGYLCMHIGASLERKMKKNKRVLVCTNGASSGKLLSARLMRNFKDLEIVDVIPVSRVMQYERLDQIDFIVSTVPFRIAKDVVVVSPFLNEDDMAVLENAGLSKVKHLSDRSRNSTELTEKILSAVSKYATVENEGALRTALGKLLAVNGLVPNASPENEASFDVKWLSQKMARKFKATVRLPNVSLKDLELSFLVGIKRLLTNIPIVRYYPEDIKIRYPVSYRAVENLIREFSIKMHRTFDSEEIEFLTACVSFPAGRTKTITEVSMLTAKDLKLNKSQMQILEMLIWGAFEGAAEAGILMERGVLLDLALHLASTLMLDEDTSVLREVASGSTAELTSEMLRAGKFMATRMSKVLGRKLESWEETYLAFYAGSAVLRRNV